MILHYGIRVNTMKCNRTKQALTSPELHRARGKLIVSKSLIPYQITQLAPIPDQK